MWNWVEHLPFWQVFCLLWVGLAGIAGIVRALRGKDG